MMRRFIDTISAAALVAAQLAMPALAAPDDRMARPQTVPGNARPMPATRPYPQQQRPQTVQPRPYPQQQRPQIQPPRPYPNDRPQIQPPRPNPNDRPQIQPPRPGPGRPDYNRPPGYRPPGYRPPINTYPIYRPPGGGYYRPPSGGYYRPPRPPVGGWHGGYYPPPQYYYDDGPSVGGVIAGVAVTAGLLALLSSGSSASQPANNGYPPQSYAPPPQSTGAPALINVDLGGLTPAARPSASTCLTEAARQIGATGGREIRLDRIVDVEQGNGGYRFRLNLIGVYPDESRTIPMYCRATPEKIVELTFG